MINFVNPQLIAIKKIIRDYSKVVTYLVILVCHKFFMVLSFISFSCEAMQ